MGLYQEGQSSSSVSVIEVDTEYGLTSAIHEGLVSSITASSVSSGCTASIGASWLLLQYFS